MEPVVFTKSDYVPDMPNEQVLKMTKHLRENFLIGLYRRMKPYEWHTPVEKKVQRDWKGWVVTYRVLVYTVPVLKAPPGHCQLSHVEYDDVFQGVDKPALSVRFRKCDTYIPEQRCTCGKFAIEWSE